MNELGDGPHIQPSEIPSSGPATPPGESKSLKTDLQGHTVTLDPSSLGAATDKASSVPVTTPATESAAEGESIHAVPLKSTPATPEDTGPKTEYEKLSERFGFQTNHPFPSFIKVINSVSIKQFFQKMAHSFSSAGRAEAKEIKEQKNKIKQSVKTQVKSYVKGDLVLKSTSTNSYVALLDTIKADVKNGRFTDSEIDSLSEDVIAEILYDLTAGRELPDSHKLNNTRCENVNKLLIDREAIHVAQSIESGTLPEIMNGPYPAFVIPPKIYNKGLATPDELSKYKAELYDKSIVSALKLFAQTPEGRIKAADSFCRALRHAVPSQRKNLINEFKSEDPLSKNIQDKLSYVSRVDQHLTKMDESARAQNRSIVAILQRNFGDDRLPEVTSYAFNAFVDGPIMDEMIQVCAEIGEGKGSFEDAHSAIMHQTEELFPPGTLSVEDYNTLSQRVANKLLAFAEDPANKGSTFSSNVIAQTKNTKNTAKKIDDKLYVAAEDCASQFKTMNDEQKTSAIQALLRGTVAAKRGNAMQFLVVLRELSDDSTKKIIDQTLEKTLTVNGRELQLLSDIKEVSSVHDSVREKLTEISANYDGKTSITELLQNIHTSINEGRPEGKKISEKGFMQAVVIVKGSIKQDPNGFIERITERDSVARMVSDFRGKRSFADKWGLKSRKWQYELKTTSDPDVSARRMSQFCALYVANGPKEGKEKRLTEVKGFLSNFLPRLSQENRAHFRNNLSQIEEISKDLHKVADGLFQTKPTNEKVASASRNVFSNLPKLTVKMPNVVSSIPVTIRGLASKANRVFSNVQEEAPTVAKAESKETTAPEEPAVSKAVNQPLVLNHLSTGALRTKLLTIYRWQMTSKQFFTELAQAKSEENKGEIVAVCREWLENDAFNSGDVGKVETQIVSLCEGDKEIEALIATKKGAAQQSQNIPEGSGDLSAELKKVGQGGDRGTLVEDLASDLRFRSAHVFGKITMDDLADQKWAKDKKWDLVDGKRVPPAGLKGCTDFFNNTASFVVDAILSEEEQVARTRQIEFFIDLADTCFEQGDYQTFMAIVAGLGDSSVNRLKSSWQGIEMDGTQAISDAHKEKMNECQKRAASMVEGVQLGNIRKAVSAAKLSGASYIPFPGIYLTDITFGDDKNPDTVNNPGTGEKEINLVKFDVLAVPQGEIISAMSNLGKPKEGELKFQLSGLLKKGSPNDNYKKSLVLEPREEEQMKIRTTIGVYKQNHESLNENLKKIAKEWDTDDLIYLVSSNLLEDAQVKVLINAISKLRLGRVRAVKEAFKKRKKEGISSDETGPPSPAGEK